MICSGDKLVCTVGNPFFKEGSIYTVGKIVTKRLFEIKVGSEGELWYATIDDRAICVHFDSKKVAINDAWFCRVD